MNRRSEILAVALESFKQSGYEATPITDIVLRLGVSQAAFDAHFESKGQLVVALVGPFIDALESTLDRFPRHPSWPDQGQELLSAYLHVLIRHRDLIIWIDQDKAVLRHPQLGERIADTNRRVREAIRGDNRSSAARFGASAVLAALWQPLRELSDGEVAEERDAMLAAAVAVVATVRAS